MSKVYQAVIFDWDGTLSVAITYGVHDETVLRMSNPTHLINDIAELKSLVVDIEK